MHIRFLRLHITPILRQCSLSLILKRLLIPLVETFSLSYSWKEGLGNIRLVGLKFACSSEFHPFLLMKIPKITSNIVKILDKGILFPLPFHHCGRKSYTSPLTLADNNNCIQKVGSFPWPNDIVSLHYADDILLLVLGDIRFLISLKLLLYEFETMMGLKINFHKSFVYNLSESDGGE